MTLRKPLMGVLGLAILGAGLVAPADAYVRHHRLYHRHVSACKAERRSRGNTGTAIGAIGGGILGNAASNGGLGGTLLGAGAGAVVGHHVAKSTTRC